MKQIRSCFALLCVFLVAAPPVPAQQPADSQVPRIETGPSRWYSGITRPYEARTVPPVNVSNSSRIDSLLRGGNLYLSLSDAIALAIENNLDVELERYEFPLAEADLLRARSGAPIQGIPTAVSPGVPAGAGSILGSTSSGLPSVAGITPLPAGQSFDPFITGNLNFGHTTTPQSNTIITGTPALITNSSTANFGISQTFASGGSAALTFNNNAQNQNSFRSSVNPSTISSLDLTITQPLLQGFGLALNNRAIRIAKNNVKAADYVFRQQLTNTVANIVALYWNLVAANSTVNVQRQAVAVAQKLYDDNQKQVEIGTLAPIEIVRAEAQLAQAQQALVTAQSQVQQLEVVLKSALSRNGTASPALMDAHVIPTDPIRIPEVEPVQPVQDLVARALDNRPDLAQSRIQIDNAQIALAGTKNALLPTLSAVGDLRSNALIGSQNTIVGPPLASTGIIQNPPVADPFFIGGYSGILAQLFGRNFPTYSIGANLTIPLRNRAAQANIATATLNLRQSQLQVQRLINQIRVDVQNALIAVQNARAEYQAAVKQRVLQEQTLDADQKKLALGATTVYQVIQDQRDLTNAAAAEVSAQAQYAAARVQLDVATGLTLQNNNVEFEEAKTGHVSRPPSPVPTTDPNR
jgi:outer membrane protein